MKRLKAMMTACLAVFCVLPTTAQAQTVYVTGEAGAAILGPPLVSLSEGAVALTSRVGLGLEFRNFQIEADLGLVSPLSLNLGEGVLAVPSIDGSFLFGKPSDKTRAYVGGGIDTVVIVSDFVGALPWAHLTAGVDRKLSSRSSVYLEARTYALEHQLSLGSKFRF